MTQKITFEIPSVKVVFVVVKAEGEHDPLKDSFTRDMTAVPRVGEAALVKLHGEHLVCDVAHVFWELNDIEPYVRVRLDERGSTQGGDK